MLRQSNIVRLAGISTALSFAYISESLERHSLTERPRLSSFLILLLSGGLCFAASFCSKWLPGADGRFVSSQPVGDSGGLLRSHAQEGSSSSAAIPPIIPNRPRRYSLPVLVCCIVARLEVFHLVNHHQQCATPGIESFLCFILFCYEIFATRQKWGLPPTEDPDDPWRTVFDDLYEWFTGSRVTMVMVGAGILGISVGTFKSVSQITRSTYICFAPVESRAEAMTLQLVGLALDACIMVLVWRLLGWTRTLKLRLRTTGTILCLSAACMLLVWAAASLFSVGARGFHMAIGTLYIFDIFVDSVAFATLLVSIALWVCETSPIVPTSTITVLAGIWSCSGHILSYGDWLHLNRATLLVPCWVIFSGTIVFIYWYGVKSVLFVRRILVAIVLFAMVVGVTIYVSIRSPPLIDKRHPITDFIYNANVAHNRWVTQATTSSTLAVAVTTYEERHPGKSAPPNFSEWYNFAQGTLVVDEFSQMDDDLEPFWRLKPSVLRSRVDAMASMPGVSTVTISQGRASHSDAGNDEQNKELDQLVAVIEKFVAHLPDMILPINLSPTPRILPSWEESRSNGRAEMNSLASLISKRSWEIESNVTTRGDAIHKESAGLPVPSANEYRQMQIEACDPTSRARSEPRWNVAEFCAFCVRRHSKSQFLSRWDRTLETCQQSDIKYLHEMFMTRPELPPVQKLLPLFSPSKTDSFSDILLPLPSSIGTQPDIRWAFPRRYDSLIWRGTISANVAHDQALRGSHKYRLLHLVLDPAPEEEITMMLPAPHEKAKFAYEKVLAFEANTVVPFNVGIGANSACHDANCEFVKQAYGVREEVTEELEFRYVLLVDEDNGPPQQFMRTMKSDSVPFLSTLFRTWYSERLTAWLHFVPIDVRYHGLHSTYAYFTGTESRTKVNGRDTKLKGNQENAAWIASEGRKWAEKAVGPRDLETYLFRLLLEWGRLIDDQRDVIGFRRLEQGGFDNIGWSQQDDQA